MKKPYTHFQVIEKWEGTYPQAAPLPHDEDEYVIQCPVCGGEMDEYSDDELWCRNCRTGLRPVED